jgi:SAM-dependent methyltransferase
VKTYYSSCYTKKSFYAPIFLLGNYLSEVEPRKRLSGWKRLSDYITIFLECNDKLFAFHREINQILLKQTKEYSHYDYGEGYFYQSFPSAHISGFRDTTERVKHLGLQEITKNKSVLDIGCNTGFILISLAGTYKSGFGFDFNPYLIEIANATKSFMEINNTDFAASSFEDIDIEESYDVVLSLANHSTYDGNTKQDLDSYFKKISDVLNKDGVMVFESHPPAIENTEQLDKTLGTIRKLFQIKKIFKLPLKGFLDKNRTYVIANKIESRLH